MEKTEILNLMKKLAADSIIVDYDKIPEIDLYMDQLTTFTEDKLKTYKRNEADKILTKTMINNYSKDKIIPPSTKKKYSKSHIALILMIFHLKNNMAINDIGRFFENYSTESDLIEELYNDFTAIQHIENQRFEDEITKKLDLIEQINHGKDLPELAIMSLLIDANTKKRAAEKILDELLSRTEAKK